MAKTTTAASPGVRAGSCAGALSSFMARLSRSIAKDDRGGVWLLQAPAPRPLPHLRSRSKYALINAVDHSMAFLGKVFASFLFGAVTLAGCQPDAQPQDAPSPLVLEQTISLPNVKGRIDHLAVDLEHKKLFVAELENGTVEAIDLATGTVAGRIGGLSEPQGL